MVYGPEMNQNFMEISEGKHERVGSIQKVEDFNLLSKNVDLKIYLQVWNLIFFRLI